MAFIEIHEESGEQERLELGGEVTIGRGADNTVRIPHNAASRHHAALRARDHYYIVVDLGSSNGTFVNKARLHQFVPQPLYDADEIEIAGVTIVFRAQGAEPLQPRTREHSRGGRRALRGTAGLAGGLSIVMTGEDAGALSVDATMDASANVLHVEPGEGAHDQVLRRLEAMVSVSSNLGTVTKTDDLLERIMDHIFDMFPAADRAFIMLRDRQTGDMVPATGRRRTGHPEAAPEEFPVSRTIVGTVVDRKQSLLVRDAREDQRFARQQSVVDLSIRSLMCVPFIYKDELLGIIGVDTAASRHDFSGDDLALLTGVAAQAAIAIKNAELYRAVEKETQIRTQLSRYLSPDVVEGVIDGTIPLKLGGEKKHGTVLFCDIVGFTGMSESLSATEVIDRLNVIFDEITSIVTGNGGTLHKFGGDMVMAFWNVMFADPRAEVNAIRASIQMQLAMWLHNLAFEGEGLQPTYIGIGCNTGDFAGGNIGGNERMEYTVVGDNVNLGQRIESLAGRWQVFVSEETYRAAASACVAVELPPVTVKGKSEPIKVYSVRGIDDGAGSLLLDIPVFVLSPDDETTTTGILVRCTSCGSADTAVELLTAMPLPSRDRLTVQFDLPEVTPAMRLGGQIVQGTRIMHSSRAEYSRVLLGNIDGRGGAASYLRPGMIMESSRSWEQMKRH